MPVPGTMLQLDDPPQGTNHPYVFVKDGTVYAYWSAQGAGGRRGGEVWLRTSPVQGFPNFGPRQLAFDRTGTIVSHTPNGYDDFAWFYHRGFTYFLSKGHNDSRVVGLYAFGWQPTYNAALWHPMLVPNSLLLNADDYPWVVRQSANAKFWEFELTQAGGELYIGMATGFANPPQNITALMVWKVTELTPTSFHAFPIAGGGGEVLLTPTAEEVSIHGGALYEYNGQVLIAYDSVNSLLPGGTNGPRYPTYKGRIAIVGGYPTRR
jgi:hypothetical protein